MYLRNPSTLLIPYARFVDLLSFLNHSTWVQRFKDQDNQSTLLLQIAQ